MNTNDIRVTNLKMAAQHGGTNQLAAKLGYTNGSFISAMIGPTPSRQVSEHTARKFEDLLGLTNGWLDRADAAQAGDVFIDSDLVTNAINSTAEAVTKIGVQISPTKLGKLSTLVYHDARLHGRVRPDFIDSVVDLLAN